MVTFAMQHTDSEPTTAGSSEVSQNFDPQEGTSQGNNKEGKEFVTSTCRSKWKFLKYRCIIRTWVGITVMAFGPMLLARMIRTIWETVYYLSSDRRRVEEKVRIGSVRAKSIPGICKACWRMNFSKQPSGGRMDAGEFFGQYHSAAHVDMGGFVLFPKYCIQGLNPSFAESSDLWGGSGIHW